ncbi:MAG: ABC-F family ATP-binding cassette domain-containing protein, partial [Anaerolineae bacterium]|nr:ABC-F family ATP-binding cassette domain-containing protein [Anaerolineae bacterium]
MSILSFHNISQAFGAFDVFTHLAGSIPNDGKIGLVGPNGIGKTTLLLILAGLETPTSGSVSVARGKRLGYLRQEAMEAFADSDNTVYSEMLTVFAALREQEARLRELEERLGHSDGAADVMDEYAHAQEAFEKTGGYEYETRVQQTLKGLGFGPDLWDMPLRLLSGGQKTRALLARLLLEAPDLLALDEPTNHLDIQSVEWLEGYLKDFPGAVLAVSHDRSFMDAVASVIWELDFGALETYRGNYSAYALQREERHERLLKEYEAQQAFIAKEEDYIRRNMAGQNTRQAQGRLKRLERLKRDDLVLRPRRRKTMGLR